MTTRAEQHQRAQDGAAHGGSLPWKAGPVPAGGRRRGAWRHRCIAAALTLAACDGGAAPAPTDPDDVDGDGIANATDACPDVVDPEQLDEDGDRVGDACDVCPSVRDPAQLDRGELDVRSLDDGVGDACDPRPSLAGDRLAALHTFAASAGVDGAAAWVGAGWTIGDGHARALGDAAWRARRRAPGDVVAARLSLTGIAWLDAAGAVGVALDGDGASTGRTCAIRAVGGDDELEARELGGAVASVALPPGRTGPQALPATLVAQRGVDAAAGRGKLLCRVLGGPDGRVETKVEIPLIDATTTGDHALLVTAAEVALATVAVYGSPTACPRERPAPARGPAGHAEELLPPAGSPLACPAPQATSRGAGAR
jgi:hypothetical protein